MIVIVLDGGFRLLPLLYSHISRTYIPCPVSDSHPPLSYARTMFTKTCLVATALVLVLATTGKSSRKRIEGKGKDRAISDASDNLSLSRSPSHTLHLLLLPLCPVLPYIYSHKLTLPRESLPSASARMPGPTLVLGSLPTSTNARATISPTLPSA